MDEWKFSWICKESVLKACIFCYDPHCTHRTPTPPSFQFQPLFFFLSFPSLSLISVLLWRCKWWQRCLICHFIGELCAGDARTLLLLYNYNKTRSFHLITLLSVLCSFSNPIFNQQATSLLCLWVYVQGVYFVSAIHVIYKHRYYGSWNLCGNYYRT